MFEVIAFLVISVIYFFTIDSRTLHKSDLGALFFAALYLFIYLGVPPHIPIKSTYAGQFFGLLPMLSLCLILFPEINLKAPARLTQFAGWFMLFNIGITLVVFKVFIW